MTHTPVMPHEALEYLNVQEGKIYIDATLGGGGHSKLILEKLRGSGHLYSFDQDINALTFSSPRLTMSFPRRRESRDDSSQGIKCYQTDYSNWTLVYSNFENIEGFCESQNIKVNGGILFDLGLSSLQLDDPDRGFSFNHPAPLDMRLNPDAELTAADIVNRYKEKELADILYKYGDERLSRQIAKSIIKHRPIMTTIELAQIIRNVYIVSQNIKNKRSKNKKSQQQYFRIHPATRSFQALRVYINRELEILEETLTSLHNVLEQSARIVVISFQSHEDRIVKKLKNTKIYLPLCKKPITPRQEELDLNPRARSAKLRAVEYIC